MPRKSPCSSFVFWSMALVRNAIARGLQHTKPIPRSLQIGRMFASGSRAIMEYSF